MLTRRVTTSAKCLYVEKHFGTTKGLKAQVATPIPTYLAMQVGNVFYPLGFRESCCSDTQPKRRRKG